MRLSILIPLYNEEKLIAEVLDRIEEVQFPEHISEVEVVIVDDCSTDNSYQVVKDYIQAKTNHKLLRQQQNQGKGAAVHRGIAASKGELIVVQDADLELHPGDIPLMLNALQQQQLQFVNGSRYLPGPKRPKGSESRYMANRLFTWFTNTITGARLSDMACGYKLIHRSLLENLNLREKRFGFEAELVIKAMRKLRTPMIEVPVHYAPRKQWDGKKLTNIDGLRILWVILKYGLFRAK